MQLQLSLTLADELHDLLLLRGEPVDFLEVAQRLLALRGCPESLCRQVMSSMVEDDQRFCWWSPTTIGLGDWRLSDPDLSDVAFCVVDLETTGTRPGEGKITEIGAVRIEGLREVGHFETLINPQRPIHPKVIEITGITPQMVLGAPRIEEVMPHFLDFLRGAVIVAHNANFDLSFLNYELTRLNGRRLGDGAIDTVLMARCLAPGLTNYKLGTVSHALGSPVASCHRALADARATSHVFLTLVGRLQEQGRTRLNELRCHVDPGHKGDRHKIALTKDLPRSPGTYLFLDDDGIVLYVGKAEVLRDRVRSYFLSGNSHSRKVRQAVRRLRKVQWEETVTPLEALVREQELILDHRPPCNVFGRRPENYVYLKLAEAERGARLYLSDRPGWPGRPAADGAGRGLVLGPFRGRSRVQRTLDLLQRCYPIRRCAGAGTTTRPCLFGATGRCLAPCSGDEERREEHNRLVNELVGWLCNNGGPREDPAQLATALMKDLSSQQRYEEAEEVRASLDDMRALKRSYRALREATDLSYGLVWPLHERPAPGAAFGAGALLDPLPLAGTGVRVDLVWRGRLVEKLDLNRANAGPELGRVVRKLLAEQTASASGGPPSGGATVWVKQEELDLLLAARRWLLDSPGADVVRLPERGTLETCLEEWRRRLLELVQSRLAG